MSPGSNVLNAKYYITFLDRIPANKSCYMTSVSIHHHGFHLVFLATTLTHWPLGDLKVIFNMYLLVLLIGIFKSSYDNGLGWMLQDLTDDKSTLVQEMAWCRQATSYYLNHCWPRSPTPYGVTRPQWVNSSPPEQNGRYFTDNIFKCIFINEKFCILIKISLRFVPKGPIVNISVLV